MISPRARFRQTLLALAAALAMLVQAMLAPAAMAAPATLRIEICTEHGVKTITVPDPSGKQTPAPCSHCEHCLAPALAAPAGDIALAVEPALYAAVVSAPRPTTSLLPYAARAPPRPPGQAPPQS